MTRSMTRPRNWLGVLALCAGVLVTVSTPAPYYVRTQLPVASSDSAGPTLRIRDVLVVLPGPFTRIHVHDRDEASLPWDGAPVLTLRNDGTQPVVFRAARVSLVLTDARFEGMEPRELSLGPGECLAVRLGLRTAKSAPEPRLERDAERFCFGELVFADGTVSPIEGAVRSLRGP